MKQHHTLTTPGFNTRWLHPMLRRGLLLAATLLGGCAALQIDVDVYKGPLVHDEDTQVQQLASIAMSGKSVMLLQRNTWLDQVEKGWSSKAPQTAKSVRARHLRAEELDQLGIRTKCENVEAGSDTYTHCRHARLINDMLSAYDDRVEPALADPMAAVGQRYRSYQLARSRYASAMQQTGGAAKAKEQLKLADDGLRWTWVALVELLHEAKRGMPQDNNSAHRAVERQSAEILAQLTDPSYLLCAAHALPPNAEIASVLAPMKGALNVPDKAAGALRAVSLLNGALRMASAGEILRLRSAAWANFPLVDGRCAPSQATPVAVVPAGSPLASGTAMPPASATPPLLSPRYTNKQASTDRTGVHREATGSKNEQEELDEDLRDIDDLWNALMQLGASGFDRGRPQLGLDRLADAASEKRFKLREGGGDKLAALADADQAKQLHDSVVDLASRMQFLAVNLQLVNSSTTGTDQAFKSTLETIANTLLVLAEDQRRQRQHRDRQVDSAADEQAAAVAAFKTDGAKPELSKDVRRSTLTTLERVEAYLNYRRIDALQRGAPTGATVNVMAQDADSALAALAALMQRRERMSYIRPASMYLRSALATTAQQIDPTLDWSNLLTATFKRLMRGETEDTKKAAAVRAELDKSFWQNVNQVRVSAGGTSNFAIAKDDVGNWYVKAMGSDPAKMVAAAKSLALYNLGGRVDANFIRMDELRNKSDRNAQDNKELGDLLERKNGASATAYGNTLQVFEGNHAKTVKTLLSAVQDDLKLKALHTALQERWAATYEASTARLAAVNTSLIAAPVQQLHDKAMTAAEDGMVGTAGTTPSSALIDTLALLAQQRGLLKSQLTGMVLLTDTEVGAVAPRQAAVDRTAGALAKLQEDRKKLADELARLLKERGPLPADPSKAALQTQIDEQQRLLNVQGEQIGRQHADWVEAQKLAKAAVAALATARSIQTRALEDVDAVWQKYVKDIAARQLRAVEEMETAARVVSQGVQGKPAKQ